MSSAAPALILIPITLVLVLVLSAVAKLKARESTASAVRLLRLPSALSPELVSRVLPPAEIVLAVAMLSPWLPLARAAALGALLLFLAYWVIIARAMTFNPRPSCGCFGLIGDQRVTSKTLTRNTILLAGAAAFVWMTWVAGQTVFSFFDVADAREWMLLLGSGYAVLVAWFILSPPAPVRQRPRGDRAPAGSPRVPAAGGQPDDATADQDEYIRRVTPDAILLDSARNPVSLQQLAQRQPVLLIFITCSCPSTHESWSRLDAWSQMLPGVRVIGVETSQFGDLGVAGVGERLFYDPAARAFAALRMPGTSSAILLGADQLIAGGPVLGNDEIEEFVEEISQALSESAAAGAAPAE